MTGDEDVVEQPQVVPSPTQAPADTGAASDETVNPEAESPEDDAGDGTKPASELEKLARKAKKDADRLTRLRRDAERDRDHWREMAMRAQTPAPATPTPQSADPLAAPQEKDFQDYGEFIEARAAYRVRQEFANAERNRQQAQEAFRREESGLVAKQRIEQAAERYEDFHDVVHRPDVPISVGMIEAFESSEKIGDILYYLGKNPAEAQRISQLPPYAAAREIGKIEAKIAVPPVRKPTAAPEPPATVPGNAPPRFDPARAAAADSPDDWMTWRNKQIAEQRKARRG